jgi:hypothetical protein
MEKILYYPNINLPNNKWTSKTLLYWDKIGSIVPRNYGTRDSFDSFTGQLFNQGFLEKVDPYDVWMVPKYESCLNEAINNGDKLIDNSRINFANGLFVEIHFEKFYYNLFENLIQLKIAHRVDNSDWIRVESNVAKLMMTFLATVLSLEKGYQPITDNIDNLELSYNNIPLQQYSRNILGSDNTLTTNIRTNLLENLLPYPIENDLNKIIRFKERHFAELTYFRKHIERIIFEISLISDENLRTRAIQLNLEELIAMKNEIVSKMKENNFSKIFFTGTCGLLATATPMIIDPQLIGIPALIYGLYTLYKETNKEKIVNPIKYLALVDRNFNN